MVYSPDLLTFIELFFDGKLMEWDMHELPRNGMGWGRKISPIDKPEIC